MAGSILEQNVVTHTLSDQTLTEFFLSQIPQVTQFQKSLHRKTPRSTFISTKAVMTAEYQSIRCAHIPSFIFSFSCLFLDTVLSATDSVYSLYCHIMKQKQKSFLLGVVLQKDTGVAVSQTSFCFIFILPWGKAISLI